jgi:hypothetical protein
VSPQRNSGYVRRPNEHYPTPAWLASTIAPYLRRVQVETIWEPANGVDSPLSLGLVEEGFAVVGTDDNFLQRAAPPTQIDAVVTNPPFGHQGKLACDFIRHALSLEVRIAVMLLRVDFDSGRTRVSLFRDNPSFAGKIVLLDRIKWFPGDSGPSDNHCFFVWDRNHRGEPRIAYAARAERAA